MPDPTPPADGRQERIAALEAALRALVASDAPSATVDGFFRCGRCLTESVHTPFPHEPDCPWLTAKALLAERGEG